MSLVVENLTKIYGDQHAVDNISFSVHKGEILGFLGPNGAGKSTTMKIATCYIPPSSGTVKVCGFDVEKDPMAVRKKIGYLPENNPLYTDMYIREYLGFMGSLYGMKGLFLQKRIDEMIEITGLVQERKKKVGQLSKGYRQRVGLAQALIHDPEILILDEPTTGLDPNQIVDIRNLIKEVGKEKTIIFSTHIMQEVQSICDRVIIINSGKIVADNHVSVLSKQQNQNIKILLEFTGDIRTEEVQNIPSVIKVNRISENKVEILSSNDIRSEIFKLFSVKGWILLEIKLEETSMEKIFQELTKEL